MEKEREEEEETVSRRGSSEEEGEEQEQEQERRRRITGAVRLALSWATLSSSLPPTTTSLVSLVPSAIKNTQ